MLYPPAPRDFLLTVAALDGFVPIWSRQILHEVERNVLEDNPSVRPWVAQTAAKAMQLMVDYDPQPPFDSGALANSSQQVIGRVIEYAF